MPAPDHHFAVVFNAVAAAGTQLINSTSAHPGVFLLNPFPTSLASLRELFNASRCFLKLIITGKCHRREQSAISINS